MTDPANLARWRNARIAVAALLTALSLWLAVDFVPALIWAAVIAVAIDPLVLRLLARGLRPVWAAVVATAIVALAVLVPLGLGIAQAAGEARDLALWVHGVQTNGLPPPVWLADLPGAGTLTRWWLDNLGSGPAVRGGFLHIGTAAWIAHTKLIGAGLLHRGVIFAFTLLTLFFLVRDRTAILAQLRSGSDRLLGPAGERIARQAALSVRGTIDGLVLVGLGEGAAMAIAYLALGVPHPLLLGVVTAVAAMIPFGAAVAIGIAALLLIGQGSVVGTGIVVVVGLLVIAVADHVFRPVLIGQATRLPFVWVLVGILGGVERLGLLGLFVGPAVMAVLVMLWREFVTEASAVRPAPFVSSEVETH